MPNMIQMVDQLGQAMAGRNRAIRKWYDLIRLDNNLAQDDMESVISPDPRSSFNMASWLLKPKVWKVRVDTDGFTDEQIKATSQYEQAVTRELIWHDRRGRGTAYGSPITRLIKLALSTGWFTFANFPGEPHWLMNVFNPVTVYPQFDVDGRLVAVARKYRMYTDMAKQMLFSQGWQSISTTNRRQVIVRSLWVDNYGDIIHGVSVDNEEVRPLSSTGLSEIPLHCFPVGGLPDDGSIVDSKWMEEIGQSLVAGVMELQHNINKLQTYLQQILRDTANAALVTRTSSGQGPVTPENRFKRGNIYDLNVGEDIYFPPPPPLSPDMRTHGIDMHQQAQRAMFPDVSFGNFSQSVSVFLMTQATAGTQQVLDAFLQGVKDAIGIVVTQNTRFLKDRGMPVLGQNLNSLPDLTTDFDYDLIIPGDFINRINSARMANPEFTLSQQTIMDTLIPEVRNYAEEQQRKSTDRVVQSELYKMVEQLMRLREAALDANDFNDIQAEQWFTIALQNVENQLRGMQGGAPEGVGASFDDLANLVQ